MSHRHYDRHAKRAHSPETSECRNVDRRQKLKFAFPLSTTSSSCSTSSGCSEAESSSTDEDAIITHSKPRRASVMKTLRKQADLSLKRFLHLSSGKQPLVVGVPLPEVERGKRKGFSLPRLGSKRRTRRRSPPEIELRQQKGKTHDAKSPAKSSQPRPEKPVRAAKTNCGRQIASVDSFTFSPTRLLDTRISQLSTSLSPTSTASVAPSPLLAMSCATPMLGQCPPSDMPSFGPQQLHQTKDEEILFSPLPPSPLPPFLWLWAQQQQHQPQQPLHQRQPCKPFAILPNKPHPPVPDDLRLVVNPSTGVVEGTIQRRRKPIVEEEDAEDDDAEMERVSVSSPAPSSSFRQLKQSDLQTAEQGLSRVKGIRGIALDRTPDSVYGTKGRSPAGFHPFRRRGEEAGRSHFRSREESDDSWIRSPNTSIATTSVEVLPAVRTVPALHRILSECPALGAAHTASSYSTADEAPVDFSLPPSRETLPLSYASAGTPKHLPQFPLPQFEAVQRQPIEMPLSGQRRYTRVDTSKYRLDRSSRDYRDAMTDSRSPETLWDRPPVTWKQLQEFASARPFQNDMSHSFVVHPKYPAAPHAGYSSPYPTTGYSSHFPAYEGYSSGCYISPSTSYPNYEYYHNDPLMRLNIPRRAHRRVRTNSSEFNGGCFCT